MSRVYGTVALACRLSKDYGTVVAGSGALGFIGFRV